MDSERWPALPLQEWQDTYRTLQLWTQVIGKVRMTLSPPLNHWWHVTLYVNELGLTTGPIPYPPGLFEIQFDFVKHALEIRTSAGTTALRPLIAESVASFYKGVWQLFASLGISVQINPQPQELPGAVPFDRDFANCSYDAAYANRFWRILLSTSKVMQQFRSRFIGKCSPVHFFWGGCDLACTRFSGRPAKPPRKGIIQGPAYSHEVCSVGFWPGGGGVDAPAFYCYTIPVPAGLENAKVGPAKAGWNSQMGEFIFLYDDMRLSDSPEADLLEFFQSTYDAGATLAKWDRAALEA
jgi:hypothetical protein